MTQINLSKTQFFSGFSGLGNPIGPSLSFPVPATNVSTPGNVAYTFTTPLSNTSNLTSREFQMTGLDSNWYLSEGWFTTYYDASNNLTSSVGAYYVIEIEGGFSGSSFMVNVTEFIGFAWPGIGSVIVPAFTLNFNLSLFTTPF